MKPENEVETAAPSPIAVPTAPSARLKRPVSRVRSATISGTSTPSTEAEMPSKTWMATSQ